MESEGEGGQFCFKHSTLTALDADCTFELLNKTGPMHLAHDENTNIKKYKFWIRNEGANMTIHKVSLAETFHHNCFLKLLRCSTFCDKCRLCVGSCFLQCFFAQSRLQEEPAGAAPSGELSMV